MKAEGWIKVIEDCQHNDVQKQLLAQQLEELDNVKQYLREQGLAVTGEPLTDVIFKVVEKIG